MHNNSAFRICCSFHCGGRFNKAGKTPMIHWRKAVASSISR